MDNVVLASEVNENTLMSSIFDSDFGYVNLKTDFDGVTRSIRTGLYQNVEPFAFIIYKKAWNNDLEFEEKEYFINFASSPGSFDSVSVYNVLHGDFLNDFDLKNKIVLIGATAPNLHDTYFVPTSQGISMSGVEIHANIIQNLILNNFLEK